MVEKRERTVTLEWRVASLAEGAKLQQGIIPISAEKFNNVKKLHTEKGYMHGHLVEGEMRYEHHSTKGLYLCINEGGRTIKAVANGQSALSQVEDDFGLPMYKSD